MSHVKVVKEAERRKESKNPLIFSSPFPPPPPYFFVGCGLIFCLLSLASPDGCLMHVVEEEEKKLSSSLPPFPSPLSRGGSWEEEEEEEESFYGSSLVVVPPVVARGFFSLEERRNGLGLQERKGEWEWLRLLLITRKRSDKPTLWGGGWFLQRTSLTDGFFPFLLPSSPLGHYVWCCLWEWSAPFLRLLLLLSFVSWKLFFGRGKGGRSQPTQVNTTEWKKERKETLFWRGCRSGQHTTPRWRWPMSLY